METRKRIREQEIVLAYLTTKFGGCDLTIKEHKHKHNLESEYTVENTYYYVSDIPILLIHKTKQEHSANFTKQFLREFISWFPNIKYKRRYIKEWFFTTYNISLPEGCVLHVR